MPTQPTTSTIEKPGPFTIETTPASTNEVASPDAANAEKKRWLWVRCANEPGPLSSEMVATVSTHETQLWCSYRSPQDVYRLIAELVQSGVVIHEVRKLSPDLRTWLVGDAICSQ